MESKSIVVLKLMFATALFLVILVAAFVLLVRGIMAQQVETFPGEIMDSACGRAGSHTEMIEGVTAKTCTLMCVQHGARFVLYNAENKKVYKLDDQERPAEFAGDKVKVSGTFDKSTNTIHVSEILGAA